MKRLLIITFLLLPLLWSCKKETVLNLSETEITAPAEGLTKTVTISVNNEWSASSSVDWCTISPSSGNATTTSVTVTIKPNETYDSRTCNVTVVSKELSMPITVNQDTKLGLIVNTDKFNLDSSAQEIEVDVSANVEYDIAIDVDWIKQNTSKALTSEKLYFNINENETYDAREGEITISQKGGTLSRIVTISQAQMDAIILSQKQYNITNEAQSITVELKTNIDYEVIIPNEAKNWVSITETKALRDAKLMFDVTANESYSERTAAILVKDKDTALQDTLFINQDSIKGLFFSHDTSIIVHQKGGNIGITVQSNTDYEMSFISATEWLTIKTKETKETENGLTSYIHTVYAKSNIVSERDAAIIIKDKESDLADTITVSQEYEPFVYWVTNMGDLSNILTQITKDTINKMIVKGEINSSDFSVLNSLPQLKYLDLKEVNCKDNEIPYMVFRENHHITTIILPEGLTSIGECAFYNCTGFIGQLNLPEGLTSIGDYAFSGCSGFIGQLNLPEGLTSIGNSAFSSCSGFTGQLNLPEGLTSIGESVFNGCSGFTSLSFGNKLTVIRKSAFRCCYELVGIISFPSSIEYIYNEAFSSCNKINAFKFSNIEPISYISGMFPSSSVTIQVPNTSVDTYKAAEGWKDHPIVGY